MFDARLLAGVSWWFMGSSVVGSTPWAITTVPLGAAQPASGQAAINTMSRMPSIRGMSASLWVGGYGRVAPTLGRFAGRVKTRVGAAVEEGQRLLARRDEAEGLGRPGAGPKPGRPGAPAP